MPLGEVSYSKPPPDTYCCSECSASDVKLWRQYQTVASEVWLLCMECACDDQDRPLDHLIDPAVPYYGDQIGGLVPAVPTEDGTTYWGYTSVPLEGVTWWHQLSPQIRRRSEG